MHRLASIGLAAGLILLAALPATAGQAGRRPFSDWLDAQQAVLDPSVAIELQAISWFEPGSGENIMADMDGRVAAWVAANGGSTQQPTIRGSVRERVLRDGRALVHVNLRFYDAIVYIWLDEHDFADFPNGPPLFGYRAEEIAAGATPVLGDGSFRIKFILPEPGSPLPDLNQLAFFPEEGQEIVSVGFHVSARGPLREASGYAEGTPGMAASQQIGVFQANTPDGYPVEWIRYRPAGR